MEQKSSKQSVNYNNSTSLDSRMSSMSIFYNLKLEFKDSEIMNHESQYVKEKGYLQVLHAPKSSAVL